MPSTINNDSKIIDMLSNEIESIPFNHAVLPYETFIANADSLSPHRLKAELSTQMYGFARKRICEFFTSDARNASVVYGYTSGSMRSHILYRADDGIVYVIHFAYGEISMAYYFTNAEMQDYFEDADDGLEMPHYDEPQIVRDSMNY